jgi:hypothetical protein
VYFRRSATGEEASMRALLHFRTHDGRYFHSHPLHGNVFADHNLGDGHADCAVVRDIGQVKETFRELHDRKYGGESGIQLPPFPREALSVTSYHES